MWVEFVSKVADKEINRKNCLEVLPLGVSSSQNIFHMGLDMMTDGEFEVLEKYVSEVREREE